MKPLAYIKQRRWLQIGLALALALMLAFVLATTRSAATLQINTYAACIEAGFPVLDSNPPICRDGHRNFTGPIDATAPAAGPTTSVLFDILVDGDTRAALPAHRQDLINSPAQWQSYWREVHAGLPTLPPLIPVDFATSSVVAVTLGQKLTTGYGLKITTIAQGSTGATVNLTESTPTITCPVLNQVTNRYLIVRTAKITEPVNFRITTEKHRCP